MVGTGTLNAYRSAMKDQYRTKRLPLPPQYGDDMKQLYQGLKRVQAREDQHSNPRNSGKEPLAYSLYESLCERTLAVDDGGFSHLFLTTQWNLMCRSVSVETLQTSHFIANDDSIGAIFYQTKKDQEGMGPKDPRHMYGNPMSPLTCWITALGIYLACHPRLGAGALFPGSNQKARFGKILGGLLDTTPSGDKYGTHSIRKGVDTFACGGSTVGPSIVSVCLRCGWSFGGIQDRYFRYEAAGDHYLGRVVAGLPVNSAEFAQLPPHFSRKSFSKVGAYIATVFPSLTGVSNMEPILRFCLASLVRHAEFLRSHLPPKHPLLSTFLFTNPTAGEELMTHLETGQSSWMRATGC